MRYGRFSREAPAFFPSRAGVGSLPLRHTNRFITRITVTALAAIGPRDELEAMMAAQLIAAHNAMECYRRAMLPEQTFILISDGGRGHCEKALGRLKTSWCNQ